MRSRTIRGESGGGYRWLRSWLVDLCCDLLSDHAGKKAGYLGSIYFAGSFAGSLLWGCLADHWGRRPVIMLGICGSIFSELLFGFR